MGCQRLVTFFANGILGMAFQQRKDATSASRPIGFNLQSPKTRLSFLLDKDEIDPTVQYALFPRNARYGTGTGSLILCLGLDSLRGGFHHVGFFPCLFISLIPVHKYPVLPLCPSPFCLFLCFVSTFALRGLANVMHYYCILIISFSQDSPITQP